MAKIQIDHNKVVTILNVYAGMRPYLPTEEERRTCLSALFASAEWAQQTEIDHENNLKIINNIKHTTSI